MRRPLRPHVPHPPPAYPPARLVETNEQRAAAELRKLGNPFIVRTRGRLDTLSGTIFTVVFVILCGVFAAAFVFVGITDVHTRGRWIPYLGAVALVCPAGFVMMLRRVHVRAGRALRGCCMYCGYDLRGSGELCPGCGRRNPIWAAENHPSSAAETIVRAEIDSVALRFKRFEAFLFNAVLAGGAFAVVGAYAVATEKRNEQPWPRSWLVASVLLFVIFLGGLIAVHRRGARRLRKLQAGGEEKK